MKHAMYKTIGNSFLENDKVFISNIINVNSIEEALEGWIEKGYCLTKNAVSQMIEFIELEDNITKKTETLIYKAADLYTDYLSKVRLENNICLSENEKKEFENTIRNYRVRKIVVA